MTEYRVGKPLPGAARVGEGFVLAIQEDGSLMLLGFARGVTRPEVRDWTKGKLRVGLATIEDVPWLLWRVGESWSADTSINLRIEPEARRTALLDGMPRRLTMILCDQPGAIIRGIRVVTLPQELVDQLRERLRTQLERHGSADAVAAEVARVTRTVPLEQLMEMGEWWRV